MSIATDIVRFFQSIEPGEELTALQVHQRGKFTCTSSMVYTSLAHLTQPGNPLVRERKNGIYQHRIRPGFDVQGWLRGLVFVPRPQKSEAAQAPCYPEVKPEAKEVGRPSSDRSTSVPPTPAGNKRTGEDLGGDEHRVPAKPASASAPAPINRTELEGVLEHLRSRRQTLDQIIESLEKQFGAAT